jgi:hypothetical protein
MVRTLRAHILTLLVLAGLGTYGQVGEVGITGGVMYYVGDLNPQRHFPPGSRFALGALYRYNFTDRYALRVQGLYGRVQAYDSDASDDLQRFRNLSFRSSIIEAGALFEVNFFPYRGEGKKQKKWTPFVFGGLAYFHMDPKAELQGEWYQLQPLGTEGQGTTAGGDPYKRDQVCIPFGAGIKVNAGRLDFQLEWGARRTYTDHLDDVSGRYVDNARLAFEASPLTAALADRSEAADTGLNTGRARGDGNTRDWYYYSGLTISFIITRFTDCEQQYNWMRKRR